jgi:hypothetical protein
VLPSLPGPDSMAGREVQQQPMHRRLKFMMFEFVHCIAPVGSAILLLQHKQAARGLSSSKSLM